MNSLLCGAHRRDIVGATTPGLIDKNARAIPLLVGHVFLTRPLKMALPKDEAK